MAIQSSHTLTTHMSQQHYVLKYLLPEQHRTTQLMHRPPRPAKTQATIWLDNTISLTSTFQQDIWLMPFSAPLVGDDFLDLASRWDDHLDTVERSDTVEWSLHGRHGLLYIRVGESEAKACVVDRGHVHHKEAVMVGRESSRLVLDTRQPQSQGGSAAWTWSAQYLVRQGSK